MTTSDAKENQEGGTRAGGDVETRGASQAPSAPAGGTRAGGDVETRGAAQATDDEGTSDEE